MAKCSAFLTLSVVRDGEPAPYVRLIYTVSDTKPSTPSGTAETVPDGWGLEVPVRADKKIVWVSSGVVSVVNGEYQYAEWSEPSRYTADATALSPIVQWKWGASDVIPPDEEESTVSVGDEAVLEVNGQAVTLSTNSTDWSSTIPDQPSDKPYLWKREWIYASEGVDAGWVYYCVTGKQGVEGSYNALGYTINGSSITFCGMDTDGKPTLASFRATLGGDVVLFQRKTFTISTDSNGEFHDRYFLVAYWESSEVGALALCYLTPVTETDSDGVASYRMKWVSQDGEEIATQSIDGKAYDPYVLADIRMVSGSSTIKSVTLINPTTLKSYESDYFMTIMAQGNMDDVNTVAKALDIERVFERVAAMEAFINKLIANSAFISNLTSNESFINNLEVLNLLVKSSDGKFRFEASSDNEPIVKASYDNKTSFLIHPTTGRIFIGNPDADYNLPESGFMYDPSNNEITFAGNQLVLGAVSKFSGQFETASMSTYQIEDTVLTLNYPGILGYTASANRVSAYHLTCALDEYCKKVNTSPATYSGTFKLAGGWGNYTDAKYIYVYGYSSVKSTSSGLYSHKRYYVSRLYNENMEVIAESEYRLDNVTSAYYDNGSPSVDTYYNPNTLSISVYSEGEALLLDIPLSTGSDTVYNALADKQVYRTSDGFLKIKKS